MEVLSQEFNMKINISITTVVAGKKDCHLKNQRSKERRKIQEVGEFIYLLVVGKITLIGGNTRVGFNKNGRLKVTFCNK